MKYITLTLNPTVDRMYRLNTPFKTGTLSRTEEMSEVSFSGKGINVSRELKRLEDVCRECTGCELSKYYRPPEGKFDIDSLKYAKDMGYKTVFWSIAYADWDNNNQMSEERAMSKILDNLHNGAVILLHPTSKTNANMISKLIDKIKDEGYRFGSLDEIV